MNQNHKNLTALIFFSVMAIAQSGASDGTLKTDVKKVDCTPSEEVLSVFQIAVSQCMEKSEDGIPVKRGEFVFEIIFEDGTGIPIYVEMTEAKKVRLSELNCISDRLKNAVWPKTKEPCNSVILKRSNRQP